MKWEVTIAAAVEPISLVEAKAHLRLDGDAEDAWLERAIAVARLHGETETQRSFVTRQITATWTEADLPRAGGMSLLGPPPASLALPRGPVQAIVAVKSRGVAVAGSRYELRRVGTVDFATFPGGLPALPLEVTYGAGYGDDAEDVPADLRFAMLAHVASLYRFREGTSEKMQAVVAHGMEAIYAGYRAGGML